MLYLSTTKGYCLAQNASGIRPLTHLHIEHVCCAEGASADGSAAHSQKPATPSEPQSAISFEPSIDWQLGVNGYLTAEALSVRVLAVFNSRISLSIALKVGVVLCYSQVFVSDALSVESRQ